MGEFVVVTPYQSDGDFARERAREFVACWYAERHGLDVVYGSCDLGLPWSKGVALDRAVGATDAPGLIIADADVLVSPVALNLARLAVTAGAAWAMPHSVVQRLSRRATMAVYAGSRTIDGIGPADLERPSHFAPPGGGLVVVARETYDLVGGIDDRFVGWGGEDISFARALDTLAGPAVQGDATMTHLWHREQASRLRGGRGLPGNERLASLYLDSVGDPAAMAAVCSAART